MDAESRAEDAEDKVSEEKKKHFTTKNVFSFFPPVQYLLLEENLVFALESDRTNDSYRSILFPLPAIARRSILSRFFSAQKVSPVPLMSQVDTSKEDLDWE